MNFNAKEINSFSAARYGIERVESIVIHGSRKVMYNFFFVGGNVVTATLDANKEEFNIVD